MSTILCVPCDKCNYINTQLVNEIPNYKLSYLRSYWCQNQECGKPQVIRYVFKEGVPELFRRLEPSEVFVEKEQDPTITIRPRGKSR